VLFVARVLAYPSRSDPLMVSPTNHGARPVQQFCARPGAKLSEDIKARSQG